MTDNHNWLAEYVQTGSDAAFRELVTRYVDLVYSTALRLVEGDTHRAEDVAQTVFVDLTRKARTLSNDVMLGAGRTDTPVLWQPTPCCNVSRSAVVTGHSPYHIIS